MTLPTRIKRMVSIVALDESRVSGEFTETRDAEYIAGDTEVVIQQFR